MSQKNRAAQSLHTLSDLTTRRPLILKRAAFGPAVRAEVWQLLADVMDSGVQFSRALETLADSYDLQRRGLLAEVMRDLRRSVTENRVQERFGLYMGTAERLLWRGYERQDVGHICRSCARILRLQQNIRSSILKAIAQPILLLMGIVALLMIFGHQLFPALSDIVAFERLPASAETIVSLTLSFAAKPYAVAGWIGALIGGMILSMRYQTGPMRRVLDRFPPWSLMRLSQGAGFLMAVIEYGRTGQRVNTALLDDMALTAPPYAKSRIHALMINFVPSGTNLGEASIRAGQGFPSEELAVVLRILWNEQGGIERAGLFVDRWLARVEDTIKARMATLNAALLVLMASILIGLLSVALPMVEQISGGASL